MGTTEWGWRLTGFFLFWPEKRAFKFTFSPGGKRESGHNMSSQREICFCILWGVFRVASHRSQAIYNRLLHSTRVLPANRDSFGYFQETNRTIWQRFLLNKEAKGFYGKIGYWSNGDHLLSCSFNLQNLVIFWVHKLKVGNTLEQWGVIFVGVSVCYSIIF